MMSQESELLRAEVERQTAILKASLTAEQPFILLLGLIRELDLAHLFLAAESPDKAATIGPLYRFGWGEMCKMVYAQLDMVPRPMYFVSTRPLIQWVQSALMQAGRIGTVKQLLDFARGEFIVFERPSNRELVFSFTAEHPGVEAFDRLDLEAVRVLLLDKIIAEDLQPYLPQGPRVQRMINRTVKNPGGQHVSYQSTPEIDAYFERVGEAHLLRLQQHNDFGRQDVFGGIPYAKYVDLLQSMVGVAFRHVEYCLAVRKRRPAVELSTLLSYYSEDRPFPPGFLERFALTQQESEQIMACLTLTKESMEAYAEVPSAAPAPYVRFSTVHTVRSIAGCLDNPFQFLNFELRRRYPQDYFRAVNNREERFRSDLFHWFAGDRFVRVEREVNISIQGVKTDIDCVLYDRVTHAVGLFQLKWQDPFAHSMKKRRNSFDEFYKASAWVDKVCFWLEQSNPKALLNSLQITRYDPDARKVGNLYVFVLSRHTAHFTNGRPDNRAAWGSWWQFIRSRVHAPAAEDPIQAMYAAFEHLAPAQRLSRGEAPDRGLFDMEFGDYRISSRD